MAVKPASHQRRLRERTGRAKPSNRLAMFE